MAEPDELGASEGSFWRRIDAAAGLRPVWAAYADYVRITTDDNGGSTLAQAAYAAAIRRAGAAGTDGGVRAEPWAWMGYIGERVGSASWGARWDGTICQASGLAAAGLLDGNLPWDRCPRLDLQATVWFPAYEPEVASWVEQAALARRERSRGRKTKVVRYNGNGAGDTTYVGARGKRTRFTRVYDKWLERKKDDQWQYSWRWEVELTDEMAASALDTLRMIGFGDEAVWAVVRGHLDQQGVPYPTLSTAKPIEARRRPKEKSSVLTRLEWLRGQVAPALDRLRADGVSEVDIAEALGYNDLRLLRGDEQERGG